MEPLLAKPYLIFFTIISFSKNICFTESYVGFPSFYEGLYYNRQFSGFI